MQLYKHISKTYIMVNGEYKTLDQYQHQFLLIKYSIIYVEETL